MRRQALGVVPVAVSTYTFAEPSHCTGKYAVPSESNSDLTEELLIGAGLLVSMLDERIDSAAACSREYARLSRATARELGLDDLSIARVALAAHLYGLDIALRRELGAAPSADVLLSFSAEAGAGGLGASLRRLGRVALGRTPNREDSSDAAVTGLGVVRLVADYLDSCSESPSGPTPHQLEGLRTAGVDPAMIDALARALDRGV